MSTRDKSEMPHHISIMPPLETLVVANGALQPDATAYIAAAAHVIVCDGALRQYLTVTDRKPDIIIGDGDSIDQALLEEVGVPFTLIPEQETNDLTKAVHESLRRGWRDIHIIGGTGRREDHTLGNIFLLPDYYAEGARVVMQTECGAFLPFTGTVTVEGMQGHEVSFFAVDPMPMTAEGVAYPFVRRCFTSLWQATLNHITSPTMTVTAEGRALIYLSKSKRKSDE